MIILILTVYLQRTTTTYLPKCGKWNAVDLPQEKSKFGNRYNLGVMWPDLGKTRELIDKNTQVEVGVPLLSSEILWNDHPKPPKILFSRGLWNAISGKTQFDALRWCSSLLTWFISNVYNFVKNINNFDLKLWHNILERSRHWFSFSTIISV